MEKDPYRYFRVEASDILEQLTRGAGDLERGAAGEGSVPRLLRLAHTLKGAAHVVKQEQIARLSHQFEDVLAPFSTASEVPAAQVAILLCLTDSMVRQLASLDGHSTEQQPQRPAAAIAEETFDTVRVDIAQMDELLEGVVLSAVQVNGLKRQLEALKTAAGLASSLGESLRRMGGDNGHGVAAAALAKARSTSEELSSAVTAAHRTLSFSIGDVERELEQIRDAAATLRLVPAAAVFTTLERAARNSAQMLGKKVGFEASGGENSLDPHVLAALCNALVQLVRNAVAHGIETPEERIAAGKPETGKVSIRAARRGSRIAFACSDDGRGFDVAALRRSAVERGLVPAGTAESVGPDEMVRLLLRGGVSTAQDVTEMAGRGIGLDVVRQTAAHLKADIHVTNEPGRGSTVELTVPVSLVSFDAVTVESVGVQASVPIDAIEETLRVRPEDIAHNPDGDSVLYGGRAIPLLPLSSALRHAVPPRKKAAAASAVVIRTGGELIALGVDRLIETSTVVLRPVAKFAGLDTVVAGVSLDANGNPQVVLDPAGLASSARGAGAFAARAVPPPVPLVLVIDDSLTTRMLEQSILESAGYEVDTATSGEEALQKARSRKYSLFVVDIEMPGMNGFDFIVQTQSDGSLNGIPSILVTSRSSEEDRRRGIEAGARAYIAKGEFDQGALLQKIKELVG